ncbi:MAG: Calx-beta domain-containing protein [Pseudohongiellaceae bacterium]
MLKILKMVFVVIASVALLTNAQVAMAQFEDTFVIDQSKHGLFPGESVILTYRIDVVPKGLAFVRAGLQFSHELTGTNGLIPGGTTNTPTIDSCSTTAASGSTIYDRGSVKVASSSDSVPGRLEYKDGSLASAGCIIRVTLTVPLGTPPGVYRKQANHLRDGLSIVLAHGPTVELNVWSGQFLQVRDAEVAESAPYIDFPLLLRNTVTEAEGVSFQYTTANGDAVAGTHYQARSGTATIPQGSATWSLRVWLTDAIRQNAYRNPDRRFTVTLSNPVNAELFGRAETLTATGTIRDDETGALPEITINDAVVRENAEYIDFLVNLSQPTAHQVEWNFSTADGQGENAAVANTHYQPRSGHVRMTPWANSWGVRVWLTNAIRRDARANPDRQFSVTLTNPRNALFPGGAASITAVGTIQDDEARDAPTLRISDTSVDEDAEYIDFPVRLSQPTSQRVEWDFATANGNADGVYADGHAPATSGVHYYGRSGHVTMTPNANSWGVRVWLTDAIRRDIFDDPDRQFRVTISDAQHARFPGDASSITAVGTIRDNDAGNLPTASMPNIAVDESVDVIRIPFNLSTSTPRQVEWDFATTGGTARPGVEFYNRSGHVTMTPNSPDWEVLVWLTRSTRGDEFDNPDKEFTITISNLRNAVFADGANSITATVTIRDDDDMARPPATIAIADASADEGNSLRFAVTISPPIPEQASVEFDITPGTATPGEVDYIVPDLISLTFAPNQASLELVVDTVADDENGEGSETLTVELSSPAPAGLLVLSTTNASATGTIVDSEQPVLSIAADSSVPLIEGSNAVFTITSQPAPDATLTIPITVQEAGGNFLADSQAAPQVILTAGQSSVSYTVLTEDDTVPEENSEIAVGFITPAADAGYAVSRNSFAAIEIQDNDEVTPTLSVVAGDAVAEGERASFTITASNIQAENVHINMNVSQRGRHTDTNRNLVQTLLAGQTTLNFDVTTDDDTEVDSGDILTLTLTTGSGYLLGSPVTASIALTENDIRPDSVISVRAIASPVIEGTPVVFSISSTPAAATELLVGLTVNASGNFVDGALPTAVTIPEGRANVIVEVATIDDEEDEADGNISLSVLSGDGYAAGSASAAVVVITDNDETGGGNTQTQRQANEPIASDVGANLSNGYGATIQARTEGGLNPGQITGGGGAPQGGGSPPATGGDPGNNYGLTLQGSSPLEFLVNQARSRRDAYRRGQQAAPLYVPRDMSFTVALNGSNQTPTPASPDTSTAIDNATSAPGNALTLWGRVFYQESSGSQGELDERVEFEGDVRGVMIGIDTYSPETGVLWGMSLVEARGEMDYTSGGIKGTHDTRLTGLHPYAAVQWGSGVRVWGTLGFDKGDIEINEEDSPDDRYLSDITMKTLGMGAYGPIVSRTTDAGNSLTLGFIGDGTFVRTEEDTAGAMAVSSGRLRMGLELEHNQTLDSGNNFVSSFEVTWRHDIGDGLAGGGAEVGGALNVNLTSGLILGIDARTLAYHSSDLNEWGVGMNLIWLPNRNNRGLSLTFKPQWGATHSRAGQLWNGDGSQFNQYGGTFTGAGNMAASYGLELKYGIPLSNNKDLLQLFARSNLNGNYNTTALGATFNLGKHITAGYEAALMPRNGHSTYNSNFGGLSSGYGGNYGTDPNQPFMPGTSNYLPHLQPGTVAYELFMQPYGYNGGNTAQYQPPGLTQQLNNQPRVNHRAYIRYYKRF